MLQTSYAPFPVIWGLGSAFSLCSSCVVPCFKSDSAVSCCCLLFPLGIYSACLLVSIYRLTALEFVPTNFPLPFPKAYYWSIGPCSSYRHVSCLKGNYWLHMPHILWPSPTLTVIPWYFEVFTLHSIFHMEWVDSNPIPWTPYGLSFGWQPSHFFIPCRLWSPYGIHMEWTIPWTFHVLVHMDSMWIPWNFQWIYRENSCTIPYGIHGKTINCVVKNSVKNKN